MYGAIEHSVSMSLYKCCILLLLSPDLFQFHPYVITANMMFGSLTIFHLTYLGLMFDSSPEEQKVGSL